MTLKVAGRQARDEESYGGVEKLLLGWWNEATASRIAGGRPIDSGSKQRLKNG